MIYKFQKNSDVMDGDKNAFTLKNKQVNNKKSISRKKTTYQPKPAASKVISNQKSRSLAQDNKSEIEWKDLKEMGLFSDSFQKVIENHLPFQKELLEFGDGYSYFVSSNIRAINKKEVKEIGDQKIISDDGVFIHYYSELGDSDSNFPVVVNKNDGNIGIITGEVIISNKHYRSEKNHLLLREDKDLEVYFIKVNSWEEVKELVKLYKQTPYFEVSVHVRDHQPR